MILPYFLWTIGTNDGEDLPGEILSDIYDRVKKV